MMRSSAKTQNPTGNRARGLPKKIHHFDSFCTLRQQPNFVLKFKKTFEFSRQKYAVLLVEELNFRSKSQVENLWILRILVFWHRKNIWLYGQKMVLCRSVLWLVQNMLDFSMGATKRADMASACKTRSV